MLAQLDGTIVANPPNDQIYDFKGQFESAGLQPIRSSSTSSRSESYSAVEPKIEGLSLENTLWANTVLASPGHVLGMVVYTGKETRAAMN